MKNKKEILKKILIIAIFIIGIFIFIIYQKENNKMEDFDEIEFEENFIEIEKDNIDERNAETEIKEKIKIYIIGEVNNPGVKELDVGARIEDAINSAGGITEYANLNQVNLAYSLEDGEKIYIPNINEKIEEYITKENGVGIIENSKNKVLNKININKATISELTNLPGVGESLAKRIIEYREENGKFKSIEDLKNVSGIGEKKYESLLEYITIK